jgi:uncharacterized membrane protein YfcA
MPTSIISFFDRFAIGISALCVVHCLVLPVLILSAPWLFPFELSETFHQFLVLLIVPSSAVALYSGYREHKNPSILVLGLAGVATVVGAVLLHEAVGETGEKWLTVIGSILIIIAHYRNFTQCRNQNCGCHE